MFQVKNTVRLMRLFGVLLVTVLLTTLLAACGDNTATSTVAATTAAATTATKAATTAASGTVTSTTAVATTAASSTMTGTTAAATKAATTAASTTVTGTTAAAAAGAAKISLKKLTVGLIPAENATKSIDNAQPFGKAIEKELGIPVEIWVGASYTATIEALASGKIDVAWFGPFSYVLAADKYNGEILLMQLGEGGATSYNSLIITTPKTGIKTLADLKGKSFSFVDPASTSGNLVPRYILTKNGIDPDKDVQGVFAGDHNASLAGVLSGKTDAGAVASDIFKKSMDSGVFKESEIVIIQKSDPIPNSPIAVRKEMAAGDKAAIKQAFLNIKDPEALKAITAVGFVEVPDSNYNVLRDIAKILNLDLTKLK